MIFDMLVHYLNFVVKADNVVHMGPQAGGQIRGALWQALNKTVCTAPNDHTHPDHARNCPACFLLELQEKSPRGENPPRPFAVRPPLSVRAEEDRVYEKGETFEVGITLMGKAAALFPYLVQGMHQVGEQGVGYKRNSYGRFTIQDIKDIDPLGSDAVSLLIGNYVHQPSLVVDKNSIHDYASRLPGTGIRLRFLTPMTLISQKKPLARPTFDVLMARLLERCQSLAQHYGSKPADQATWEPTYKYLTQLATSVRPVQDNTRWVSVGSGSRRSNYYQDVGGFVGEVLFEGDIQPFREWLTWGQILQVGKNTVKGNGWYEIAT